METGVHSSKDDGASAAADWACSSSWAGAWSTNDDWSGELWTPLPPNSSPAGPSASPGSPAHRKGQGVHAHPCLSGRWVGDPWLYIYIYITCRGAPGERIRWQWGQTIGDQHSKMQIENCDWQNNAADDVDLAGDDAVEVWRQAHRKFNFTGYVLVRLNFL